MDGSGLLTVRGSIKCMWQFQNMIVPQKISSLRALRTVFENLMGVSELRIHPTYEDLV